MAFNFFIMSVRKWLKIHSPRNLAKKPDVGALGGPWADPASRGAVDAAHGRMVES